MWKRKRTLKEEYGTLGHFLRGDNDCHYLGDLYIEGTNFYRHREWRGVKDTAYAFARWLQTWGKMAGLIGRDPVRMIRAFWKYRWLSAYLATPMMVDKWIEGDRGMVLRADLTAIDCMVSDSITTMWREIRADRRFGENKWTERTIAFDYTLPKHIIYGFPGYYGINIQQHAAFMVPILNKNPARTTSTRPSAAESRATCARCRSWRPASPSRASTPTSATAGSRPTTPATRI